MDYKFDIGISLLERDLGLATQIKRQLEERFGFFLYAESDGQKEIAFRDGVERLSSIYKTESRGVLILMRPDWGTTRWTKIEKEAIVSRRIEKSADFLMVVPTEPMTVPDWIPTQYIYLDYEKWGMDVLVAAVAAKIKTLGGEIRELTAVELAKKHQEEAVWESKRQQLLYGMEANNAIDREVREFASLLEEQSKEIMQVFPGEQIYIERQARMINITRGYASIIVELYENSDPKPYFRCMSITEYDGLISLYGNRSSKFQSREHKADNYAIDVDPQGNWFWRNIKTNAIFSTVKLADDTLKRLLDRSKKIQDGKIKLAPRQKSGDGFYDLR